MRLDLSETGCAFRRRERGAEPDWRLGLPGEWLSQVVRPWIFTRQRDAGMDAERVLGYAAEGDEPCYCRFVATLRELRCDDDEHWYMAPTYGEQLAGWRLRDDRWLIHRRIFHGEDCQAAQSFFTFSDSMPR